jgi:hypothetical protein
MITKVAATAAARDAATDAAAAAPRGLLRLLTATCLLLPGLLLPGLAFALAPVLPGVQLASAAEGSPALLHFQLAPDQDGLGELPDIVLPAGTPAALQGLTLELTGSRLSLELTADAGAEQILFDTLQFTAPDGTAQDVFVGPSQVIWLTEPPGPLRIPQVIGAASTAVPFMLVLENSSAETLEVTAFSYAPAPLASGWVLLAETTDAPALQQQLSHAHGEQMLRPATPERGLAQRLLRAAPAGTVPAFEPPPGVRWLDFSTETLEIAAGQKVVLALAAESFLIDLRNLPVSLEPFVTYRNQDGRQWQQQPPSGVSGHGAALQ